MTRVAPVFVVLASMPYVGHQLYEQRLARALRAHGDVVYVNPAAPVFRLGKHNKATDTRRRRRESDGVEVLTPWMLPLGRRRPLSILTAIASALQVRLWVGRRRWASAGIVAVSVHPLVMRFARRRPAVALVKDDYTKGVELTGLDGKVVGRRRRKLLSRVDHIAVVSPMLQSLLLREGFRTEVIPPGALPVPPVESEPTELDAVPHPRAVFVGLLSDRIDFELLAAVVEAGAHIVLVGRQQYRFAQADVYERLLATGRVHALGEMDPDRLAAVVASCDVGLVPYTISDFNAASFPLKTLEYLAAGTPVIASALPAVLWLDLEPVSVVSSAGEVAEALHGAVALAAEPGARERIAATVSEHTWDARAQRYADLLTGGSGR